MGLVRELAVVANRSTRRGGAGDEGEDEQEIFKALPLDYWTEEGKMEERRGEERTGKGRKRRDHRLTVPFEPPKSPTQRARIFTNESEERSFPNQRLT